MLDANESADAPSSFVFLWFQIQNSNSYPLIGFKRIQISSLFISKLSNLASQPAPILGVFVKIWGTFCLRVCCEWNCGGGRRRGGDNGRQKDEVMTTMMTMIHIMVEKTVEMLEIPLMSVVGHQVSLATAQS
nr:PREDICTED: uncharacterized protein LOC108227077 [Daucus carota subsp. sativus]